MENKEEWFIGEALKYKRKYESTEWYKFRKRKYYKSMWYSARDLMVYYGLKNK